jgi:hypothetical protein
MGLKENQYYDRDTAYSVAYRQKKNINTKKQTEIDLKIRSLFLRSHFH